jgi:hypothetical protein
MVETGGRFVLPGLEALFQEIAESIVAGIPEEWSTARFEAIYFSDSSLYEAEYSRKTDGVPRSFEPAEEGIDAFDALRQRFVDAGQPVWGRAVLELNHDGTFGIKWGYDDCDANGDTIFDEEQELARRDARRRRLTQP